MVTVYGKILRKIRIDHDELLKNMADKLQITSAYLSSIENGKRPIPNTMTRKLAKLYKLSESYEKDLYDAEDSIKTNIEFNLEKVNPHQKAMVLALARQFEDLTDKQLEEIRDILEK